MQIEFVKMQGAGNDFIMIDNRAGVVADDRKVEFVKQACPRALAVGADGVIFIENDAEFDFKWDFYNADGSSAEMCGNGSRCAAVYANMIGAAGKTMTFRTIAGPIRGEIVDCGAKVQLTDAKPFELFSGLEICGEKRDVYFINTGVPHAVVAVDDLPGVDIRAMGAAIRYHDRFAPAGTNANFMQKVEGDIVAMRTYERGVEDETLACGTGAVACSIVASAVYGLSSPVKVRTSSGDVLAISYNLSDDAVTGVFLSGPAKVVYSATMEI